MQKIETDITNTELINVVVIPRLKHVIDNQNNYTIRRPSLGKAHFCASTILNSLEINIITGMKSDLIYLMLRVGRVTTQNTVFPLIDVTLESINPVNVTDGADKFHKTLCDFFGACLQKETNNVISDYNKLFAEIDQPKVVKIH